MLVGVDFDNTIVCYDELFHRVALEQGLVPQGLPATKGQVRDYLRQTGREAAWIQLQGYVYGSRMRDAAPFHGALEFFVRCRERGIAACIISHRTRYPFLGSTYDLHQAAYEWLEGHGFYDPERIGFSPSQVYFKLTKEEKMDCIAQVVCSHFIDDLPEFLAEPDFPAGVVRILFDPNGHHPRDGRFLRATSWAEIERLIINGRISC